MPVCKAECRGSYDSSLGGGENNICHVVYAYEMLASDVCYLARVCGGPWLGQDAVRIHP